MDEGRRVSECSYAMIALIDTIRYDEREQAIARRSSSIVHRVRVRNVRQNLFSTRFNGSVKLSPWERTVLGRFWVGRPL